MASSPSPSQPPNSPPRRCWTRGRRSSCSATRCWCWSSPAGTSRWARWPVPGGGAAGRPGRRRAGGQPPGVRPAPSARAAGSQRPNAQLTLLPACLRSAPPLQDYSEEEHEEEQRRLAEQQARQRQLQRQQQLEALELEGEPGGRHLSACRCILLRGARGRTARVGLPLRRLPRGRGAGSRRKGMCTLSVRARVVRG